ncbi:MULTISPECIES: hypothetical protein [Exiguobacterium]|uniref:DUF1189 domain-containing protein n=1 Tax=Exiguobacterium aurantiacum TaxID=33987 RepID=A0A377FSW7_9BACL|nr:MULTISPECIES: hypothetical protein [Exiguobacterium]STO07838.1 Uncharacterised protein [Exiguobacterium aurantiacum]
MLKSTTTFIRHSLIPTKQALRLRLAPLHAYMIASIGFAVLVTIVDYIMLQPDFFAPMWLFLHGFAVFFFYMITVALAALYVQLITRVRQRKAWPYRQAWPYAVAMTIVPMFILIVLFHLSPAFLYVGIGLIILYLTVPLTVIPAKKKHATKPKPD